MVKIDCFSAQVRGGGCIKGLFFIAACAFVFVFPQYSKGALSSSEMPDEKQPSSIPSQIQSDWNATGSNHEKRVARLKPLMDQIKKIIYTVHFNQGGAIYGYTEDLNSDGSGNIGGSFPGIAGMSKSSKYKGGSSMKMLEFDNYYPTPKTLLEDTKGVIRDPCVSFDGTKVVFAWSKNNNGYNLYELTVADKSTRQITSNPASHVVSDFEPCYTPDGNIIFVSSRCFNHVDCNFNLVSNLYLCNKDGKYIRRISYDQVNIFSPSCTDQGNIIYSRWEYNDRNVMDAFGVFTMNPDGSHQNEHWGNQLGSPAGKCYASWVPGGKGKFLLITAVHMGAIYNGDLCFVDPAKGRNDKAAATLIAPKRGSPGGSLSSGNRKFQFPYALNEDWFLVSYAASGSGLSATYNLYLMNQNGDRELLAWDSKSCLQGKAAMPRKAPPKVATTVDYSKTTASANLTNAYYGINMNSVAKGSIKKIRCIALNYRVHPWVGNTGASAYTATPVARYNGSWESKRVLGEMKVEEDGSAAMILPPRTPIYFQLIDGNGCCIQSARSWTTLMPGEKFDCYGCHEDKNASTPPVPNVIAKEPKELQDFYGRKNFFFHFDTMLQKPIIDKKCISCHGGKTAPDLTGTRFWTGDLSDADNKVAERYWTKSYLNLSTNKYVNYISIMDMAAAKRPNSYGSGRSALITKLKSKSGGMSNVDITQEDIDKFAMWIDLCIPFSGDYVDDMKPEHRQKYEARLKIREDLEAVEEKDLAACVAAHDVSCFPTGDTNVIQGIKQVSSLNGDVSLFDVHFFPNGSKLVIRLPGEGKVAVMDLLGRQIMSRLISKELAASPVTIRTKLPKGIYIIKFKGVQLTGHKLVNVLQ